MKWTEFRGIGEKRRHKEKLGGMRGTPLARSAASEADRYPRRLAGIPALHGIRLD